MRYRLVTEIPQGTLPNFRLTDLLPAGLVFLNDGTDQGGFRVQRQDQDHSSTISDADPAPAELEPGRRPGDDWRRSFPTFVLPAGISGGPFVSGTDPVFSLGNLTNSEVGQRNSEYVVLEFNALVQNTEHEQQRQHAEQPVPRPGGHRSGDHFDYGHRDRPRAGDPEHRQDTAGPLPGDAGDPAYFRITFSNTGTTTAFDVRVLDPCRPGRSVRGQHRRGVPSWRRSSSNASAGQIGLTLQRAGGRQRDDHFTATLTAAHRPGETVTNTANVTYTSLPGTGTPLGPNNTTGSTTPGGPGQRTANANGSGGALNDTSAATAPAPRPVPAPSKSLVGPPPNPARRAASGGRRDRPLSLPCRCRKGTTTRAQLTDSCRPVCSS